MINPSPSTSGANQAPKAYLNILFFDDQFKFDAGSSVVVKCAYAVNSKQTIDRSFSNALTAQKSGYVYIYFSNESETQVYFDNFMLTHERGSLTEETHYYPFGLIQSGISSKSLNFGTPSNKFKFNGIEQNNDFDLNMYDAHYRNLDPQVGRFWQLDPKPNETFTSYAAMANNPILFSDPLGDTTWLYNQRGYYCGVVNDNLPNQVHFLNLDGDPGTPLDLSSLTSEQVNAYGEAFRKLSVAFMGSNTMADMKAIKDAAVKDNKKVLFTGTVGKDEEIRLTAVKTDKGEYAKIDDVDKILDAKYTKEQQANLFLIGHVHQQAAPGKNSPFAIGNPLQHFGRPSSPDGNGDSGDYGPYLYRSATATQRGQSPALILSRYGFTVYGTATAPPTYMPQVNSYLVPGRVVPSTESYFLYKQLKK